MYIRDSKVTFKDMINVYVAIYKGCLFVTSIVGTCSKW